MKVYNAFNGRKTPVRMLMLGLDAAGKTTILYKLKLNETVNTIPTIGFNVENLQYKNLEFNAWDVGGQWRLRNLWSHYFQGTNALCFVVDSADRDRLEENAETLLRLTSDEELKDAIICVYANKQDLPNAISTPELVDKLGLTRIKQKWFIQNTCARTGDGLYEGLDWIAKNLPPE